MFEQINNKIGERLLNDHQTCRHRPLHYGEIDCHLNARKTTERNGENRAIMYRTSDAFFFSLLTFHTTHTPSRSCTRYSNILKLIYEHALLSGKIFNYNFWFGAYFLLNIIFYNSLCAAIGCCCELSFHRPVYIVTGENQRTHQIIYNCDMFEVNAVSPPIRCSRINVIFCRHFLHIIWILCSAPQNEKVSLQESGPFIEFCNKFFIVQIISICLPCWRHYDKKKWARTRKLFEYL